MYSAEGTEIAQSSGYHHLWVSRWAMGMKCADE